MSLAFFGIYNYAYYNRWGEKVKKAKSTWLSNSTCIPIFESIKAYFHVKGLGKLSRRGIV